MFNTYYAIIDDVKRYVYVKTFSTFSAPIGKDSTKTGQGQLALDPQA